MLGKPLTLEDAIALAEKSGGVAHIGGLVLEKVSAKELRSDGRCKKRGNLSWPRCNTCHLCSDCCEETGCPKGRERIEERKRNWAAKTPREKAAWIRWHGRPKEEGDKS